MAISESPETLRRVARGLEKIARTIEKEPDTWCQGTTSNGKGAHCLLGHVEKAFPFPYPFTDRKGIEVTILRDIARGVLRLTAGGNISGIATWNDAEGRTAADVTALCRKAAIALKHDSEQA